MQLDNAAAYTETGIVINVVNENQETDEEGRRSGAWLTSWAFPAKMTAEAIKCNCDLPKVESQSFKAMGHETSTEELSRLVKPL